MACSALYFNLMFTIIKSEMIVNGTTIVYGRCQPDCHNYSERIEGFKSSSTLITKGRVYVLMNLYVRFTLIVRSILITHEHAGMIVYMDDALVFS